MSSYTKNLLCINCKNCFPIGDGDFLCDVWDLYANEPQMVISDYEITDEHLGCKGAYFEQN